MKFKSRHSVLPVLAAILLILSTVTITCNSETPVNSSRRIDNITAFIKLYGYVRFFYPGDEAATVQWDRFAVYGARRVEQAADTSQLKQILEELFVPIAPALQLFETSKRHKFSTERITPTNHQQMNVVSRQHYGVKLGNSNIYKSVRLNRIKKKKIKRAGFGSLTGSLPAKPFLGKMIRLRAAVKVEKGKGQLWMRVDLDNKKVGFFDNMGNRPITRNQWNFYEITGTVAENAQAVFFGCMLTGEGSLLTDDFQLLVKDKKAGDEGWKPVTLINPGFENDMNHSAPAYWGGGGQGYAIEVEPADAANGKKSLRISSTSSRLTKPIFDAHAGIGDHISKDLGSGLSCLMPLAVYGNDTDTFPIADAAKLKRLKQELATLPETFDASDQNVRFAALAVCWNVIQHFFPYFDVIDTDWGAQLPLAVADASKEQTPAQFLKSLKRLMAHLKDGHGNVYLEGDTSTTHYPPIRWQWIEEQLVVTAVYDETPKSIQVGDLVKKINGTAVETLIREKRPYISAGHDGWFYYRAVTELLAGTENSKLKLTLTGNGGKSYESELTRIYNRKQYRAMEVKKESGFIDKEIFYLNLHRDPMPVIMKLMPQLQKAKAIICDMRGYPKGNHGLISYLLEKNDTAREWMQVPQVIYPDFQKVTFHKIGWGLPAHTPHLDAKLVYLTNSHAISYAESYTGFFHGYNLATIIGEPTAGANGNVNTIVMPGGYKAYFTGMKVVKHDGTRLFAEGFKPDILVKPTIDAIRNGKDLALEKAIERLKD